MGSGFRIVWPPATTPPNEATVRDAALRISTIAECGKFSGKAATLTARRTWPPIANMSLQALAAAFVPKSSASSTRGGKKSTVLTRARSGDSNKTAASSNGVSPTSSSAGWLLSTFWSKSERSPAPNFAAHPPHVVHSVSRTEFEGDDVFADMCRD